MGTSAYNVRVISITNVVLDSRERSRLGHVVCSDV